MVWKEWKKALEGRAVSKKEAEEEGELFGVFFYRIYEFLFSFSNPSPVIHNPSVPARYVIKFVRPSSVISRPVSPVIVHSVISSSVITTVSS